MEESILQFRKFFCFLGEICLQISEPCRALDVSDPKPEVKENHPNALKTFSMGFRNREEFIRFILLDTGKIVVIYDATDTSEEKTVIYESMIELRKDTPYYIQYMTRYWNPLI